MTISSWFSPKVKKLKKSLIHEVGLFAIKPIKKGEIVFIKGGHIIERKDIKKYEAIARKYYTSIDENFVITPLTKRELPRIQICLNHSCDPNVGVRGEITFVAMRDIATGEEITMDYAMTEESSYGIKKCRCDTSYCRKILKADAWKRPDLQKRYGNHFSAYLLEKML